jgi:hypothetical protein
VPVPAAVDEEQGGREGGKEGGTRGQPPRRQTWWDGGRGSHGSEGGREGEVRERRPPR